MQCNVSHVYLAGSQSKHLISSKLFNHPDKLDSLLICSGDEALNGAYIWEKDIDKPLQKFNLKGGVVFDVGLYKQQEPNCLILTLLSERFLNIYKWSD